MSGGNVIASPTDTDTDSRDRETDLDRRDLQATMKSRRGKSGSGSRYKLSLPLVLLCCMLFFLAGFWGSSFISQVGGFKQYSSSFFLLLNEKCLL